MTDNQTTDASKTRKTVLKPGKEVDEYEVSLVYPSSFYSIKNKNGGPVPIDLSGSYTSNAYAETAINNYMNKRRKGG